MVHLRTVIFIDLLAIVFVSLLVILCLIPVYRDSSNSISKINVSNKNVTINPRKRVLKLTRTKTTTTTRAGYIPTVNVKIQVRNGFSFLKDNILIILRKGANITADEEKEIDSFKAMIRSKIEPFLANKVLVRSRRRRSFDVEKEVQITTFSTEISLSVTDITLEEKDGKILVSYTIEKSDIDEAEAKSFVEQLTSILTEQTAYNGLELDGVDKIEWNEPTITTLVVKNIISTSTSTVSSKANSFTSSIVTSSKTSEITSKPYSSTTTISYTSSKNNIISTTNIPIGTKLNANISTTAMSTQSLFTSKQTLSTTSFFVTIPTTTVKHSTTTTSLLNTIMNTTKTTTSLNLFRTSFGITNITTTTTTPSISNTNAINITSSQNHNLTTTSFFILITSHLFNNTTTSPIVTTTLTTDDRLLSSTTQHLDNFITTVSLSNSTSSSITTDALNSTSTDLSTTKSVNTTKSQLDISTTTTNTAQLTDSTTSSLLMKTTLLSETTSTSTSLNTFNNYSSTTAAYHLATTTISIISTNIISSSKATNTTITKTTLTTSDSVLTSNQTSSTVIKTISSSTNTPTLLASSSSSTQTSSTVESTSTISSTIFTTSNSIQGSLIQIFDSISSPLTYEINTGLTYGNLRNAVFYNEKYYVCDANTDAILVFSSNWSIIQQKAFTTPRYIELTSTGFVIPCLGVVYKTDFNLNIISSTTSLSNYVGFRSTFFDQSTQEILFANSIVPRIDIVDLNLNFLRSITVPTVVHSVFIHKGLIYTSAVNGGMIYIIQNETVIRNIQTLCASTINQLYIDSYDIIAAPCTGDRNTYLYYLSGTYTGRSITIDIDPMHAFIGFNQELILIASLKIFVFPAVLSTTTTTTTTTIYTLSSTTTTASSSRLIQTFQTISNPSTYVISSPVTFIGLRNFEIFNGLYYVPDAFAECVLVFNSNWVYQQQSPFSLPYYIEHTSNGFVIPSEYGVILTDNSLNTLSTNTAYANPNGYRGAFFDEATQELLLANDFGTRIDFLTTSFTFLRSISFPERVHGVYKYNDVIYVNAVVGGKIYIVQNGIITTNFQTLCTQLVAQIFIDSYGIMAVPCYESMTTYLYYVNGTYTGLSLLTDTKPLHVAIDLNNNVVIIGESKIYVLTT